MFVLRSGEQMSGELVDMGGSGFQVRVGGAIRQIPTGDVAVIDFSGSTSFPDSEVNQVQAGKHLMVLSSGQVVSGNLYDVGGTQPKRISVHTDTGNRDFRRTRCGASTSRARAARARGPYRRARRQVSLHTAGDWRTDPSARQPAVDRHRASPCARETGSRSTPAAKCSSARTAATRPAGGCDERTASKRTDGQRARRRADRTCGPGGGLRYRQRRRLR